MCVTPGPAPVPAAALGQGQPQPPQSHRARGDDTLAAITVFGRWHLRTWFFISVTHFSAAWQILAMNFFGAQPEENFVTLRGKMVEGSELKSNISWFNATSNSSSSPDVAGSLSSYCKLITELKENTSDIGTSSSTAHLVAPDQTEPSSVDALSLTYDKTVFGNTILTEWDLVCDKDMFVHLASSLFMVGMCVGSLAFSALSDRYGRKSALLAGLWLQGALGVGAALSTSYTMFTIFRFMLGMAVQGIMVVNSVMCTELFPTRLREYAQSIILLIWCFAFPTLSLMAYCIKSWRYLQLAISLPTLVTAAFVWVVPESLYWLKARGYLFEFNAIVVKARAVDKADGPMANIGAVLSRYLIGNNGVIDEELTSTNDMCMEQYKTEENDLLEKQMGKMPSGDCSRSVHTQTASPISSARYMYKTIVSRVAFISVIWFVSSVVYFGLTLNSSSFSSGDPYLVFSISGVTEIIAVVLALFLVKKLGRRIPLSICLLISALCLLTLIFIPTYSDCGVDLTDYVTALAIAGRFALSLALIISQVMAPELFPTTLRNMSVGCANFAARIGGILAPFAFYVTKYAVWIPPLTFSLLAVLASFITLFLPETKGKPLAHTMVDLNQNDFSLRSVRDEASTESEAFNCS